MNILSPPKLLICLLLPTLGAGLIAGCGNKGPLYLPTPAEQAPVLEGLPKKPATFGPVSFLNPLSE